ncbi:hypothetical protein [Streptomyces sp. NPDC049040]
MSSNQWARVLTRVSLVMLVPVAVFAGVTGHPWVAAGLAVAALTSVPRAL